ncbi:hypothetical protein JCM9534A_49140 [Catenuloplanes indicus JCM 9534]
MSGFVLPNTYGTPRYFFAASTMPAPVAPLVAGEDPVAAVSAEAKLAPFAAVVLVVLTVTGFVLVGLRPS